MSYLDTPRELKESMSASAAIIGEEAEKLETALCSATQNYFAAGGRPGDVVEIAIVMSDTCGVIGAASMTAICLK